MFSVVNWFYPFWQINCPNLPKCYLFLDIALRINSQIVDCDRIDIVYVLNKVFIILFGHKYKIKKSEYFFCCLLQCRTQRAFHKYLCFYLLRSRISIMVGEKQHKIVQPMHLFQLDRGIWALLWQPTQVILLWKPTL